MSNTLAAVLSIGAILVVFVPTILSMLRLTGGISKGSKQQQHLLQNGIPANGRIMQVQMGGMTVTTGVHRHLQLQLVVEVHAQGQAPYHAQLTQMFSELQVPQLQPGATVQVRYDRSNPMVVAIAGIAGYGGAFQPVGTMQMPQGAKIGMWVGIIVSGLVILGGIASVLYFTGIVGGFGGGDEPDEMITTSKSKGADATPKKKAGGSKICHKAMLCCLKITEGGAAASQKACRNLIGLGVLDPTCQATYDGYKKTAKALGKTCK